MTQPGDPGGSLLAALARPRVAGSDGVAAVEDRIENLLSGLGLRVERQAFVTNTRRLVAVSIGAAGYGWVALLSVPLLVLNVPAINAAVLVAGLCGLVGLLAHGLATGRLPLDLPDIEAHNLVATRGTPRVWLVAHTDSKAQGVSMAGRIVALAVASTGLAGLIGLSIIRTFTPVEWGWPVACAVLAALGAARLSVGPLRTDAPGAVDNASGMIAVLAAAEALRDRPDVGVLVTGAEELGMVGARMWMATNPPGDLFVNFDGIDDRGQFNLMPHPAGDPERAWDLVKALGTRLREENAPVRSKPLPVGVFVDGGVLEAGGMPGVTVSRGDWSTLGVVHTPRDTADRLTGASAERAGRAAAEALRPLLGDRVDPPEGHP